MTRLALTERVRASPYYPALVHPVFRRILPGAAASALGDGMSAVAIAWLALKLAPPSSRGLWVGAAVAAYTLPGARRLVAAIRVGRGRQVHADRGPVPGRPAFQRMSAAGAPLAPRAT